MEPSAKILEETMTTDTPVRDPLSTEWEGITFVNPITGERIEPLEIESNAESSRLVGRLTVEPGGIGPPAHVHPAQEERFEVERGELTVHLDGEERVLTRGQSLTVPSGHAHRFENRSSSPVVFLGTSEPGGRLIHVLTTLFGLAQDGKTGPDGTPHFLQAMVFAQAMKDTMYLSSPPRIVQAALWNVFAPIGRALGYQATYDRYLRLSFWEPTSNG